MTKINYTSVITCPNCNSKEELKMPNNACLYFYNCNNCDSIIKSLNGDCCVFCSYGNVCCPPKQKSEKCC